MDKVFKRGILLLKSRKWEVEKACVRIPVLEKGVVEGTKEGLKNNSVTFSEEESQ